MLKNLEERVVKELQLLEIPPHDWVLPQSGSAYDVVIVGAGMAGLCAGFALVKEGIRNIQIFDASPEGFEGPWDTYAHMLTLRSGKHLAGPALGIPSLTFQAWYRAKFGEEAWDTLYKIPTHLWMEYLRWYRQVLQLPVQNQATVHSIYPEGNLIKLGLDSKEVLARKVVLATGRGGFGGVDIPLFMQGIAKDLYAHTSDQIDFIALKGKEVGVVGIGASSFDAAAVALECGAKSVVNLVRREKIPNINKALYASYAGFWEGYYQLANEARWQIMHAIYIDGVPAPFESLDRVKNYANFTVVKGVTIMAAQEENERVVFETNKGKRAFDFVILATGFAIDGQKQPELCTLYPEILLWGDVRVGRSLPYPPEFDRYPYLGPHFEFREKIANQAPYLNQIYCFNYAATLSHGQVSGDIPAISIGAERLAKGISADFLRNGYQDYLKDIQTCSHAEFEEMNYPFFH